jgi:ZIP family zinc transporter
VLLAAFWGFLASSTLIVGAWSAYRFEISDRVLGLVMGFGAGALISAVSFELVEDALEDGGTTLLTLGLVVGALVYFVADLMVDRAGGGERKRLVSDRVGSGKAIAVGAALDGIPESIILGVSLIGGGTVSLSFLAAVVISNLPEGVASAASFSRAGRPPKEILGVFLLIALACGAAAAIGFAVFDSFDPGALATVRAFAAGALLTMTMDSMAPEAFRDAGPLSGLMAVAGFELAFLLSKTT